MFAYATFIYFYVLYNDSVYICCSVCLIVVAFTCMSTRVLIPCVHVHICSAPGYVSVIATRITSLTRTSMRSRRCVTNQQACGIVYCFPCVISRARRPHLFRQHTTSHVKKTLFNHDEKLNCDINMDVLQIILQCKFIA